MVDATSSTIGFAGDLTDPWVGHIVQALSEFSIRRFHQEGAGFPWKAFEPDSGIDVLVLHRTRLSWADVTRLEELKRERGPAAWPRIILCVSPYVRYAEIERCHDLVETVVSEATASETLASQLARMLGTARPRKKPVTRAASPVDIVSTDHALRLVLREVCTRAGYRTVEAASLGPASDSLSRADGRRLVVWDVPVLEPRWEEWLERRSRSGPVVALLGFADRAAVTRARNAGASACLDFPCALDDLIAVLDRLVIEETSPGRSETGHTTPPAPAGRSPRNRRRSRRSIETTVE